jgi:hypothetical protein
VTDVGGSIAVDLNGAQYAQHELGGGYVRVDVLHVSGQVDVTPDPQDDSSGSSTGLVLNGLCADATSSTDGESSGCLTQARTLFGLGNFFFVARRDAAGGLRLAPLQTLIAYARAGLLTIGRSGVQDLLTNGRLPSSTGG